MNKYSDAALIIVGHGSTQNPDSSAPSLVHAEEIRSRGIFAEVVTCFWKEEPSFREVLRMVDSREIFVVPNFISEGYFTQTIIPREMELTGALTILGDRVIRYCQPTGNHPRMTGLLTQRAVEVAPGIPPSETSLLIVGHGTGLNDNSAKAVKHQVRVLSESGTYAEVLATYMEEPPLIAEWDQLTNQPNVVVVPFFISDGLHSYQDIPVLLGIANEPGIAASQADVFRHNPHHLRGKQLFYASAIGTDPGFADIILDQVEAFEGRIETPVLA